MASNAPMTRYVEETIAAYEQHESMLRATVTTEHMRDGNIATFLVAGSNGREPVTRGLDGRIPGNSPTLTQNQATLVEWHDKEVRTDFNVFESQGDARRISQMNCVGVMNRKIDADILGSTGLGAATLGDSSAATATVAWVLGHQAALGEND
ncbi:MAG: phage capsid protein, partial [Exilibacterium sp.]